MKRKGRCQILAIVKNLFGLIVEKSLLTSITGVPIDIAIWYLPNKNHRQYLMSQFVSSSMCFVSLVSNNQPISVSIKDKIYELCVVQS